MKIRSRVIPLAFAALGLVSYAACTTEKTAMMKPDVTDVASVTAPVSTPVVIDGVFASNDHLQPVYFELNKSKITDVAKEIIKANAEWMKSQPPYLIRLVGFADSRGSLKKNERLAERRANGLRDAYAELGIAKERITVVTRGTEEPACQPVTEDCLAKSRRTETYLEDKSLAAR